MSATKIEYVLTANSSPEQVVEFFIQSYNIKKIDLILFIKEDISGDVLPYLNKQDFKDLGLKLGPRIKIEKFIIDNRDKLLINQDNINNKELNISIESNINSVKVFFENYLNFEDNNNNFNIDGKKLFSMNEQDMKNLGLTLGQRKKLYLYMHRMQKKTNNYENIITEKSTPKEVATFLKNKFNMSDEVIEQLNLDGESLTLLKETDIDEIEELPEEIKNEFKNYIKEIRTENINENKENEIETQKEIDEKYRITNENHTKNDNREKSEIEELYTETKNDNIKNIKENLTFRNIDNNILFDSNLKDNKNENNLNNDEKANTIEEIPIYDININQKDENKDNKIQLIDESEEIIDNNQDENIIDKSKNGDKEKEKETNQVENIMIKKQTKKLKII